MREYAFEIAVSLMFSVLILFVSIYAIGSKVVAWKSGEISLFFSNLNSKVEDISRWLCRDLKESFPSL